MNFEILSQNVPVPTHLLDGNNLIKLLPTAEIDAIPSQSLRLWCHFQARYLVPTRELVAWIRDLIGGRNAIEIGSGCGDLAFHLGIHATDLKLQENPEIVAYYEALRQPRIIYPSFVEKISANDAVEKYKPDVVVAGWVSHWVSPREAAVHGGNMYGVKEDQIIDTGATYILVGNMATHGGKPILKRPHKSYELPFIRSRSQHRALDRILVWNG